MEGHLYSFQIEQNNVHKQKYHNQQLMIGWFIVVNWQIVYVLLLIGVNPKDDGIILVHITYLFTHTQTLSFTRRQEHQVLLKTAKININSLLKVIHHSLIQGNNGMI